MNICTELCLSGAGAVYVSEWLEVLFRMQENGSLRALNFKFSWESMPPNPPSLVGANHSCEILHPPLVLFLLLLLEKVTGSPVRRSPGPLRIVTALIIVNNQGFDLL